MGLVFSSLLGVLCYPGLIRKSLINHRCGKSLREGGGREGGGRRRCWILKGRMIRAERKLGLPHNCKREGMGLPWWLSGKEFACQCRGHGFNPWSRKVPSTVGKLSPQVPTTEPMLCNERSHGNGKAMYHNKEIGGHKVWFEGQKVSEPSLHTQVVSLLTLQSHHRRLITFAQRCLFPAVLLDYLNIF